MARPVGAATKVFSIRERHDKASPYVLGWKYRGRRTQRSFALRTEADLARLRLINLINDGAKFNLETGWPAEWEKASDVTVAQAVHEWMWENMETWEPNTRRSNAEPLANLILQLTRPRSQELPPSGLTSTKHGVVTEVSPLSGMRQRLYDWIATEPKKATMPDWARRTSLPLVLVTDELCRKASAELMRREDGSGQKAASTQARFRSNITAFFDWCIEQKYMAGPNPWPKKKRDRKRTKNKNARNNSTKAALKNQRLPSSDQVATALNDLLNGTGRTARRAHGIVLGLEYYGGLRPGEAVALEIESCLLPDNGWGTITIEIARTSTTKRWMKPEDAETGAPKTDERITTIPPAFVRTLRDHIGDRTSGLVAPSSTGRMLDTSNVNRSFKDACRRTIGQTWRQYDLRGARASLHANAGRAHAEVASEMGHSVGVLQDVYMGATAEDAVRGLDIVASRLVAKTPAKKATTKKKSGVTKNAAKKKAAKKKAAAKKNVVKKTAKKAAAKKTPTKKPIAKKAAAKKYATTKKSSVTKKNVRR